MKVLFTSRLKRFLTKNYEYAVALSILFAILIYISFPTKLKSNIGYASGFVKSIDLEREYTWARTAGAKGYRDYYELTLEGEKGKQFRRYSGKEISVFGVKNILNHKVDIRYFEDKEYKIINMLIVEGIDVIDSSDIGFFPFLLFIILCVCTLLWSGLGFYITYLVSDEKRK